MVEQPGCCKGLEIKLGGQAAAKIVLAMFLLLYNGNDRGSREAIFRSQVHPVKWDLIKRAAVRILRQHLYQFDAANTLETLPFTLWEAVNGFGDYFTVLYAKVPVAKYLEIDQEVDTDRSKVRYNYIASSLEESGNPVRFIGIDADADDTGGAIATPILQTKSIAVSRALSDFEVLTNSKGGPVSSVDRIHTALHGYLKAVCDEASISYRLDADITELFKLIREKHPKLQTYPSGVDGSNIVRGFARIVDALNPVRNRHSMAHPNEALIDEPEALLTANAVKTLLHYLYAKLR